MGKYGNGISMKTAIELEVAEATEILDRYGLSEEDKEPVLDIIKEMAFQWCQSNAFSCVVEDVAREVVDEDEQQKFRTEFVKRYYGEVQKKMAETYPF